MRKGVGSLRSAARGWRLAVVVLGLGGLLYGSVAGTDDLFPFGPLRQYDGPYDVNGSIVSTYLEADTSTGQRIEVPLEHASVGVGRADIEGQLDRLRAHPELLGELADAWATLRPDRPELVRLYVRQDTTRLRNGRSVGPPESRTVVSWRVPR
jgi:hypothetical protein